MEEIIKEINKINFILDEHDENNKNDIQKNKMLYK